MGTLVGSKVAQELGNIACEDIVGVNKVLHLLENNNIARVGI